MTEAEAEKRVNDDSDDDDDPPPGEGLSEEIFEVEQITNHAYEDGTLFFMVRWKNYGPEDDSWEPASNLGSAGVAITKYWDEHNEKKREQKEKKRKNQSKPPSKPRGRPKRTETKIESPGPEPEPDLSENEKSVSSGEEYEDLKPKRERSKGAMKSFENTKRSAKKSPPISNAKKAAIENRKSWLFDNCSDSDEDECKRDDKKESVIVKERTETPKEATPMNKVNNEKKRKVEDPVEDPATRKREKPETLVEEQSDDDEPIRSPTPTRLSISRTSNIRNQHVEHEKKVAPIKLKIPSKTAENDNRKKRRSKNVARLKFYSKFPMHKPLEDIDDLKEIKNVDGMLKNPDGEWNIFVKDIAGTGVILTEEEAYELCSRALAHYLLSRTSYS